LDTSEEQETRRLTRVDYGHYTREIVSLSAQEDRASIDDQNTNTRNFDTTTEGDDRNFVDAQQDETRSVDETQETTTRNLVDVQYAAIRALWGQETTQTETTVTSSDESDTAAFENNVVSEETTTRSLVGSTAATTQNLVQAEENQTISEAAAEYLSQAGTTISAASADASQTQSTIQTQATADISSIITSQQGVLSTWSSLVSAISSLAAGWAVSLNQTEQATLTNLMIHLDLQTGTWSGFDQDTILNQITPIDLFQRSQYLSQLRAVVNDTLVYNKIAYGSDSVANNAWTQAEQYRASGNYRYALYYYTTAYRYSVVPSSEDR